MVDQKLANAALDRANDMLSGTPYRFVRRLGEGAYGVVVEAEQVALRRSVVVKLLRRAHAEREDVVDRLRLEAQAIAALSPLTAHVVSVLDFGRTPDGRPYIVMERLEGRSLKDELAERGALPPAEAVAIATQILDGLAAAHDAGILHRDVKPDNVYLCGKRGGAPMVKLIDFGLAKLLREARPEGGPSPLAKPTDEGVMLGTPRYFAPEQARGDAATASSDLYSAGIVLYKMLAGHDPFRHCTNVYDLVKAHLLEEPRPPSETAPHAFPQALDRAVLRALAKRPEERHADARAFRAALEAAMLDGRPAARWQRTEPLDVAHALAAVPTARGGIADEPSPEPQTLPVVRARRALPSPARAGGAATFALVVLGTASGWVFHARNSTSLAAAPTDIAAPAPHAELGPAPAAATGVASPAPSDPLPNSAAPPPSAAPVRRPSATRARAVVGAREERTAPGSVASLPPVPAPVPSGPTAPHRLFDTEP